MHYNNSKFKDEMNGIASQVHICLKSTKRHFQDIRQNLTLNLDILREEMRTKS